MSEIQRADNSNNPRYKQLLPEDIEFYERVTSQITASHALPFEVPVDSFFTIVVRSLKWFWNWHENATQEQLLFIPRCDIQAQPNKGGNIDLLLPNGIEAVTDWKSGTAQFSNAINNYLRVALLQTYSSSNGSYGGQGGYGATQFSMSNVIMSLYEINSYRETFTRGIRASYNKNTQIFRLMTNIPDGLVLTCATRLMPFQMYADQVFEDYVIASIEEQLGRIVMAFDFQYPGSIKLNYDQIESYGKEKKAQIETAIKESNNMDMIQTK